MDYQGWSQAGYTEAQADAKMVQMVLWGYNVLFGNWAFAYAPATYQDQVAWQRHGLYWHGGATLDDKGDGNIADYSIPNNKEVVRIINRFKTRPNLLMWWIANEINDGSYGTGTLAQAYATGAQTIRKSDPSRPWSDTHVDMTLGCKDTHGNAVAPPNGYGLDCYVANGNLPITWNEQVLQYGTPGEAFSHLSDGVYSLNHAWDDGYRYVIGVSTTPCVELDTPSDAQNIRPLTPAEVHRYFMFQVANNVRTLDILWGCNQRGPGIGSGDGGVSPAQLQNWNNVGAEVQLITQQFSPLILAQGRWQRVVTNPAWAPFGGDNTTNDFYGIFAAKKTVSGVTYVIAINSDFRAITPGQTNYVEHAVMGAKIDVGQPVHSITRMLETGSVSLSGSVITDNFSPMAVHIYVIR